MILNRGPPSGFETSNKISNSGGTDMYIEHPYFYEGKYYANIDGEMIEITIIVGFTVEIISSTGSVRHILSLIWK